MVIENYCQKKKKKKEKEKKRKFLSYQKSFKCSFSFNYELAKWHQENKLFTEHVQNNITYVVIKQVKCFILYMKDIHKAKVS